MVGVVVIHTVGFALHAVQDDAFDIDLVLTQTVGTDFKLSGGGVAVAADQQNRTCQLSDDGCVGHCEDRRGVDNHVVVTFLGVCQQFCEAAVHQQLGRIFRITAVADEVQVFNPRFTDGFSRGDMAGKDVCQAVFGRQFEQLVQIAFTHVGIDQQYAFA